LLAQELGIGHHFLQLHITFFNVRKFIKHVKLAV
jgi:hypothetical protein